jgi:cytochrome P450
MLENSEYSPWVKTIFASIKIATFFRGIGSHNAVFKYIRDEWIFKNKKARARAWEHYTYSSNRVDRRMAREPDHEDLWSKILKKDEEDGGLTREEQVSLIILSLQRIG